VRATMLSGMASVLRMSLETVALRPFALPAADFRAEVCRLRTSISQEPGPPRAGQ
jgi:hypothetical protein